MNRDEAVAALLRLSASTLNELGRALAEGTLRHGFSSQTLVPLVGAQAKDIGTALHSLHSAGLDQVNTGAFCRGLARALSERDKAEQSSQLVLSGPEVVGTPVVDTKTTVLSLFEEAREEVLISSYVFYQAAEFFKILAEKLDTDPRFQVTFLVDLSHRRHALNEPISLVAKSFAASFRREHWLGKRSPAIWHDPRCFEASTGGILHAKTVIIDRKIVFVTSANFTEAAQSRNIEVGVLLRQPAAAARLSAYFDGLMSTGVLHQIPSIDPKSADA